MREKEQKLWDVVRKRLPVSIMMAERIENAVGTGGPDVRTLCRGTHRAIELKAVDALPKRATTRVLGDDGVSIAQKNWWLDYTKHGGVGVILIGIGGGTSREFIAVGGEHADAVNGWCIQELRCAHHGNGTQFWFEFMDYLGAKP